jgi:hypothetical protein
MKIILINKEYNIIYNLVAGLLLFCIILTPLLIQNYVITTNPLFPLYNGYSSQNGFVKKTYRSTMET